MGQEWEEQKGPQVVPPPCTHCRRSSGNAENMAGSSACQGPACQHCCLSHCVRSCWIPHGPCTSSGAGQPLCRVLPSKWHGYWHCQQPLPPPLGCAWAPGCCGFCGNASTSFSAAGASVSCWTRGGPPQCHRTPSACPGAVGLCLLLCADGADGSLALRLCSSLCSPRSETPINLSSA